MQRASRFVLGEDDFEAANRQTSSLAGLAVALFLVVVGLFLIHALNEKSRIEDCLMMGRSNCNALVTSTNHSAHRAYR